jgi:predicted dinucleotide-binding enzyme
VKLAEAVVAAVPAHTLGLLRQELATKTSDDGVLVSIDVEAVGGFHSAESP